MDRSRVAAILAGLFGAASLIFAIARVAILDSPSGLAGLALAFAFVGFIALATYLTFRASAKKTAGLMVEYLRVSERAAPGDVVIPAWFWDGPDVLADFSELDVLPAQMVIHARAGGLDFLDESDERIARVPWSAVEGIRSSFVVRGAPVPVPVITVTLPEALLSVYPGFPRRKGTGFGWLRGPHLKKAMGGLESLRAQAAATS